MASRNRRGAVLHDVAAGADEGDGTIVAALVGVGVITTITVPVVGYKSRHDPRVPRLCCECL